MDRPIRTDFECSSGLKPEMWVGIGSSLNEYTTVDFDCGSSALIPAGESGGIVMYAKDGDF